MTEVYDITIEKSKTSKLSSVDFSDLPFGRIFSDHMFTADYVNGQWTDLKIVPFADLQISPALSALHYGQAIFEGLKAFKNSDNEINIFRPSANLARLNTSAERMCMPEMPEELFLEAISQLVATDVAWVPNTPDSALYIRPVMFATDAYVGVHPSESYKFVIFTCPVGPYFSGAIKVKVETTYSRSFEGGIGFAKAAANYGAAMYATRKAQEEGFNQVIWTDAKEHKFIEESGTTNVMFVINNILITPPAKDTILKGITRDSVITLAKDWNMKVEERKISIDEIIEAIENKSLTEVFGVGTAATVAHISEIGYKGKNYVLPPVSERTFSNKALQTLNDLRIGKIEDTHHWNFSVK